MSTRTIVFILSIIGFLSLVLLVARVYAASFRVSTIAMKGTMLAALLVPFFFILSVIAGRGARGLNPIIYTIINSITGIAYYVFLGGIILSLIVLIAYLVHAPLAPIIPRIFLFGTIALGITGLIQARFVKVVDYTVPVENLPSELIGKTAILVSDTHFGQVNQQRFSDKVVRKILALRPDFVLHAGDFYDGPKINTTPITTSWKQLTAEIPVFYAPGNHEGYGNYEAFIQSVRDANVTVLDNKMTEYKGLQIAGLTYYDGKNSPQAKEVLEGLPLDPTKPSVLINHPPTSLLAAEAKGFSLMVSGHTHNGQFWPNVYLVRRIYGQYVYGLHSFETMQVLTSSGIGTFGPPVRLFNTPELVRITLTSK